MSTHRLKDLDRVILQHCEADFVPLQELLKHESRGTLYRHRANLLAAGLLAKRGRAYRTTEQGKRRLAELASNFDWDVWNRIYPPMQYVPTPQHRAVIELVTAAVVARQADGQEDHHPGFGLMGPTLAWKTTTAKFACLLLGVAPGETIIDLTTETGRSLFVRRDGKGHWTSKRALLDGPLIVFDDVLEAEMSLRPTIHYFLSGRKVVPVDNTLVRIAPVTLVTLNPRPKATLEAQTTFTTAQLRRLVLTNLANVPLPDLANSGHRAVEAAAIHGPLVLPAPTCQAETWRPHIIGLVRHILVPQVWTRVDTEMILTMVTGMTAFLDPQRAIQQVAYDFALTAETLGWTCPGWVEGVSRFSLHGPPPTCKLKDRDARDSSSAEDTITIRRNAMDGYTDSALPPFSISNENRARMIAIAVEEDVPVDHGLGIVLDYYLQLRANGHDLHDLHSVLQLSKELRQRDIPVKAVKVAMKFQQAVRDGACTADDFGSALDLLPILHEHGLSPQDDRTETAIQLAARLLQSPRSVTEIEGWLNGMND
jgi:hypothetical protein